MVTKNRKRCTALFMSLRKLKIITFEQYYTRLGTYVYRMGKMK